MLMQGEMQDEKCCFSSSVCFETRPQIKKFLRYSMLSISAYDPGTTLKNEVSLLWTRTGSWLACLKFEQSKMGLSAPAYTDRPKAELRNKTSLLQESVFVQSPTWTVRCTGGGCVFTTCQDGCRQKVSWPSCGGPRGFEDFHPSPALPGPQQTPLIWFCDCYPCVFVWPGLYCSPEQEF